jgi:hypothetical protein
MATAATVDPDSGATLAIRNHFQNRRLALALKVLTNEKRGGLKVVIFYRSSIKLFSL